VVLAELFSEDQKPPSTMWSETLISSRLLEYETLVRLNSYGVASTHEEAARQILAKVSFIELAPKVLERALQPFPQPLRTLDALHISSALFLQGLKVKVSLAAYDQRMNDVAKALKIPLFKGL